MVSSLLQQLVGVVHDKCSAQTATYFAARGEGHRSEEHKKKPRYCSGAFVDAETEWSG